MTSESLARAIDTSWVLVAAFLVFFMQAGFAMVEAGFTRAKNAGNIVLKNLMDFSAGSVAYWLVGFALMYGASAAGLLGTTGFASPWSVKGLEWTGLPIEAFWMFQVVFAGTAATIVSGAMAERTRFASYLTFAFVISALIYPVLGHWIWGGGWLARLAVPVKDFAGSTVVHSVGGWAALAGVLAVGARMGRFSQGPRNGIEPAVAGHSLTLAALGVFILWFGWFGFNPGSTLGVTGDRAALAARVAVNTNLAAATGALAGLFLSKLHRGKFAVDAALNGTLAGLVAITAGAPYVSDIGALIIGVLGGATMYGATLLLEAWRVDDAVGAIPVHGVAGAVGTLAVGLFDLETGLLYGAGPAQLVSQLIAVVACFVWTFGVSWLAFAAIKAVMGLRVTPEEEAHGLDVHEHGVVAYPDFTAGHPVEPGAVTAPAMGASGR